LVLLGVSTLFEAMTNEEREHLADCWLIMQRHWWAYLQLARTLDEQPEEAWKVLLLLIARAESVDLLETIGAGPLEDLVRNHAESFISRIESEANSNAKFATALGHVWLAPTSDPTVQRLLALGCQPVGKKS